MAVSGGVTQQVFVDHAQQITGLHLQQVNNATADLNAIILLPVLFCWVQ